MPAKRPPSRRHNAHTRDLGLVTASDPVPAPPAPSGWLRATQTAWGEFWASPQAALVMDADHPALLRLFGFRDEQARAATAFRSERFVQGSKGQPVLNPLSDHISRLERLIAALEDRFGLSPLSRLRLGVTFASAHAALDALMDGDPDAEEDDPRLTAIDVPVAEGLGA